MIIFLFIIFLSSVGVRSEEKADNSESEDNVSISLSLSRLCQGKAYTSGQGSCLKKEEKEKITGLSDKITDMQSKMMKTIAKLEKNVLEVIDQMEQKMGAEMKQLLRHIETIQPKDTEENQPTKFSATIQPTTQPKLGITRSIVGLCGGTPGASSVYTGDEFNYGPANAFTSYDNETWSPAINQLPAAIWMRFPTAHRLAAIGFKNYAPSFTPKSLKVIGSNDCATWTTLLTVENTGFTKNFEFRKWNIPLENQDMFSCLGFMWESMDEVKSSYAVTVLDIRMWEAV